MRWTKLAAALALLGSVAIGSGCAAQQGSSFETLPIPEPENRAGTAPIVLGWAYEDREGWIIRRVRVDDENEHAWDADTQEPAVLYLEPGERSVRLYAAQLADPTDPESRTRRRYRTRPLEIDLVEGEVQLCTIDVDGDERRRPVVSCEIQEFEDDYGDEYAEDEDEYGDEYDEYGDEPNDPEPAQVAAAPAAGPEAQGNVPSPFDAPAGPAQPAAQPAQPQPQPVAQSQPQPQPQPVAQPSPTPRPLSLEERVERLERQLETLRREVRAQ